MPETEHDSTSAVSAPGLVTPNRDSPRRSELALSPEMAVEAYRRLGGFDGLSWMKNNTCEISHD